MPYPFCAVAMTFPHIFIKCFEFFWWHNSCKYSECSLCPTLTSPRYGVSLVFFPVLKTTQDFSHRFPTRSENKALFLKQTNTKMTPKPYPAPANRFSHQEKFCCLKIKGVFLKYKFNRHPGKQSPLTFFLSIPWIVQKRTGEFVETPGQM